MRICISATILTVVASISSGVFAQAKELGHVDRKLFAYCQRSYLATRGAARSPLNGSSKRIIAEVLARRAELLRDLDSIEDFPFLDANVPKESDGKVKASSADDAKRWLAHYWSTPLELRTLDSQWSSGQRRRILAVYLRIEGLLALARPEAVKLFENPIESQARIVKELDMRIDAGLASLHEAVFTLKGEELDEVAIFEVQLRKQAAELDWRIVQILTDKERRRLLQLIEASSCLDLYLWDSQLK